MRQPAPLPAPLIRLAQRQDGLLSSAQCSRFGVDGSRRRALIRHGLVTSTLRGVLDVDASLGPEIGGDPLHRRRRKDARTGLLALGGDAVAVGQSALALLDVEGLPLRLRSEVAVPHAQYRRPRGPVVVRCFDGFPALLVSGARVAAPAWALAQAVCELDRGAAVAVVDSALHRHLVRPEHLPEILALIRGRRGAATVREWWDLVDGRAASPLETRARLQCVDGGIPPDDLQVPVHGGDGRVVARGDLGWRLPGGRWLIAEIDGRGPHDTPESLYVDRSRQNAVASTGAADLFRFTRLDLDRRRLVPTIRHHLATHR